MIFEPRFHVFWISFLSNDLCCPVFVFGNAILWRGRDGVGGGGVEGHGRPFAPGIQWRQITSALENDKTPLDLQRIFTDTGLSLWTSLSISLCRYSSLSACVCFFVFVAQLLTDCVLSVRLRKSDWQFFKRFLVFVCLPVFPCLCFSVCLSVRLFVYLSACLYEC